MRVAQVGNFQPEHSTENELRKALEHLAHDVTLYQENEHGAFLRLADRVREYDWVLWTRTGWDPPVPDVEQYRMLLAAERAHVPVIGYHLDRWWGLKREHIVREAPFFRATLVCTADGGHDEEFASAGVNHLWMPPGVSATECRPGMYRPELASDVAFVGSWQPGYHREWFHRPELVAFLRDAYGDRCRFWPAPGRPAVRGGLLRDLYASVKVVVGDSCLANQDRGRYWSDRVPETTGRGAFLLHPFVDGLNDAHPSVQTWPVGEWDFLRDLVDHWLDSPRRVPVAAAQRDETVELHTYNVRMATVAAIAATL